MYSPHRHAQLPAETVSASADCCKPWLSIDLNCADAAGCFVFENLHFICHIISPHLYSVSCLLILRGTGPSLLCISGHIRACTLTGGDIPTCIRQCISVRRTKACRRLAMFLIEPPPLRDPFSQRGCGWTGSSRTSVQSRQSGRAAGPLESHRGQKM